MVDFHQDLYFHKGDFISCLLANLSRSRLKNYILTVSAEEKHFVCFSKVTTKSLALGAGS